MKKNIFVAIVAFLTFALPVAPVVHIAPVAPISVSLSLSAVSIALADDTTIHNNVNVDAKGGDANAQQDQNQGQDQSQQQKNTLNNYNRRDHVTAPAGPSGNFVAGMPLPVPEGCIPIESGSIPLVKVKKMAKSGSFMEKKGGMWHGFFSSRDKLTPYVDFNGKPSAEAFSFYRWNPAKAFVSWDMITIEGFCEGDYGYPLGSTLGRCLEQAREEVDTSNILACYTVRMDIHASGMSTGAGTTGSAIKNGANDNLAGSISVAAIAGTSVGYFNKAYDVYLVGLSSPYAAPVQPVTPAPPVVIPVPLPAPVCDVSIFERIIIGIDIELPKCLWPCHNNQKLRFAKGNALMDKFYCGGMKDTNLLVAAIYEYGVAERDFENGRELKKGQKFGDKPKGVLTPTLANARNLNYKVHYNWMLALRELKDRDAQITFASTHGMVEKDGSIKLPTCQADMKR